MFAKGYNSEEKRQHSYSECHTGSVHRVLLLANGGETHSYSVQLGKFTEALIKGIVKSIVLSRLSQI